VAIGAANPEVDTDGFTGGVFVGAQKHLSGPWSLGVEGDWKYADGDGSEPAGATTYNVEQNWTASVRARLSYEITADTDVYGTLGGTWADVDARVGAGASDSSTLSGWTAGVGLQHDYTERFFVRAEYRYSDYDDDGFATVPGSNADLSTHEGLIGIGWKFRS
jgi:outer membrane immunogenic protein